MVMSILQKRIRILSGFDKLGGCPTFVPCMSNLMMHLVVSFDLPLPKKNLLTGCSSLLASLVGWCLSKKWRVVENWTSLTVFTFCYAWGITSHLLHSSWEVLKVHLFLNSQNQPKWAEAWVNLIRVDPGTRYCVCCLWVGQTSRTQFYPGEYTSCK